jgi:lysozyme
VTTLFLDVSKWQGPIDWTKVADHQIDGLPLRGAIVRAVDGAQQVDPKLAANLAAIRETGRMWAGAYHNLINAPIGEQVDHFLGTVSDWKGIIPMVDSEQGASFTQLTQFVEAISGELGVLPLVYLPRWYWLTLDDRQPLFAEWTWVHSRYAATPGPLIPPRTSLQVWQYTDMALVAGIPSRVDVNRFYGNEEDLLQLAVQ